MPLRRFFKTSLPAAADLASQTITWTIEAILIGSLSASALAGYSMAIQIVLVFFAVLLTFVVGAGLIINRHLGANENFKANHIFGQAMMMGIIMAFLFSIIWHSGAVHLFRLINENEAASAQLAGMSYLRTIAFFGPFTMINFVAVGILRAIGNTRFSMMVNLIINFINILLAPVLIFGLFGAPRLEVRGAAFAAGISHTIGFCITFYLVRSRRAHIFLSFREVTTPKWKSFKKLFKMGLPTTVEQLSWALGQLVVMGYAGAVGVVVLTTHAIFMRIQNVLSMAYMGFSMAAMSEMGQNLGAKNRELAEKTAHAAHRAMIIFVALLIIVLIVFSKTLVSVFTTNTAIIELGKRAMIIFALAQLPKAFNSVLSGNMRGTGMLRWLMLTTIIFVIIFEIGLNYLGLFVFGWGLFGIWGVQATDEAIRGALNYAWFMNGTWRKKKE